MKRLSWKYIAGLLDGEGCFDFQCINNKQYPGRPYITPRVRITMTEPAKNIIEQLKLQFGGHVEVRVPQNKVWSTAYTWAINGKRARPFLQNVKNHLILKKEQAKLQIYMIDNLMGKWITDDVRRFLKDELKAMKNDPQRLSDRAVSNIKKLML